ncbi:hypothetical protein [Sporisorium scitamineum]|uniref:Uncharacterized protein n=1 Tax=Sporisorium scitamineum TaxID=49012 RepID=A0A0F7S6F0_9BASI|nr:hypothetical protein [Sporisorium scitamineum]
MAEDREEGEGTSRSCAETQRRGDAETQGMESVARTSDEAGD